MKIRSHGFRGRRGRVAALGMAWISAGVISCLGGAGGAGGAPIWSIGKADGYTIEFAPGSREQLTYVIGKSVASRDFAGHQNGSLGFDGRSKENSYSIVFDLEGPVAKAYELVLDLVYKSGAPRQIKVVVNDKIGIFPVRHLPKKSIDSDEANMMLITQQHLVAPIAGSWLKKSGNRISIVPLGLGAMDYDAVTFQTARDAAEAQPRLEPTIFFKKSKGKLMEIAELVLPFSNKIVNGTATIQVSNEKAFKLFNSGEYDFGVWTEKLEVPAVSAAATALIQLNMDGQNVSASEPFLPTKQWKVYVCPKVHNDVGYTDLQPHVNELDNRNTDRALEIMDRFPFYKFNFETAWLVDNYLDCRPAVYRNRFFNFAVKGRATINALYLNLMTGVCSGEELYRAMYFTEQLHREHGSSFDFACLTDAPSHSWFLPSLLSDVGIKAFSNGSNQTRAPILHFSNLNEDSPYWWEGMNGERIFMWYARSYTQWKRLTGPDFVNTASNYEYLLTSVPQFLAQFLRAGYAPDAVMIYGAYVDNASIPRTGEAELIEQWNKEFEYPKLVVASDAEYFQYIEKKYSDKLPVYRGDCGAYWEDGVASSAAQTTLNRNSQQILPAAEMAHSFAALFQAREKYPAEDFWRAWRNVMFYDEHTWGAHNSVSQPDREFVTRQWEIKESYATRANLDARNLLARGLNRLCQNLAVEGDTVVVFNWQNRMRTAPVEVELNSGQALVDLESGKAVALDASVERDGWKRVRFLARDVRPMGYKGFGIRHLEAAGPSVHEKQSGNSIESRFYRLTVDLRTGAIESLYDKIESRELVDKKAAYGLNQYVYVTGGEGSQILNQSFGTPPANLTVHEPALARVTENIRTSLGQRMVVTTSCSNAPTIRYEYLLYDDVKRLDIVNTVEKLPTRRKEAVYFAFPFAAEHPAFEYQIQNGWVRPNEDQMPGACREWFTPQNLVHLRDGSFDVAWSTPDAPLVCLTEINRGKWPSVLPIGNGHIYSYVMHNYWFTNYRAEQGGTLRFRYSLTSGKEIQRAQLAEFDGDTRTPMVAYPFVSSFSARVGGEKRPLAASAGSFLSLADPNLQMVTVKVAEDGDGMILRFREIAGQSGEAEIQSRVMRIKDAQLCNGVEVNQKKLALRSGAVVAPYQPNRYVTVRIRGESTLNVMKQAGSQLEVGASLRAGR